MSTKNLNIEYQEVLVLGDSHADVFRHKLFSSVFPNLYFNVVSVGGATVSGFENPNTKTQALQIFLSHINDSKAQIIITQLGEVDTGFVIWYRAEKYGTSIEKMFEKALANYQKLLSTLSKTSRVICISTPLPTIKDGQIWGRIANLRKDIKVTQRQKTQLTIQYNKRMQYFCKKNRISYLSFDKESIGQNGLVDNRLLNSNPTDHHYAKDVYAEMIIKKLKENIEQSTPSGDNSATLHSMTNTEKKIANPIKNMHPEAWRNVGKKISISSTVRNANPSSKVDAFPFVYFDDVLLSDTIDSFPPAQEAFKTAFSKPCFSYDKLLNLAYEINQGDQIQKSVYNQFILACNSRCLVEPERITQKYKNDQCFRSAYDKAIQLCAEHYSSAMLRSLKFKKIDLCVPTQEV